MKKGDLIEMDFTGRTDGKVFDTTIEETAQEEGIHQAKAEYKPVKLIIGEGHVVEGLDKALDGKDLGNHKIAVSVEEGFGRKRSDLLEIIPAREFRKQNIKPFVGMEVNIDGQPGVIRNVSGGRTIVDFNHPLAGKELEYEVDVKRVITDDREKVESILEMTGMTYKELNLEGKKATIEVSRELPKQLKDNLGEEIERLTGIKIKWKEPEKKSEKDSEKKAEKKESK